MKSLTHEVDKEFLLKRFCKKRQVTSAYSVSGQFLINIAGHQDHAEILPQSEGADSEFMAVDVREFIVA